MNKINALVTGGSGYFGSLLVKKLLQKGFSVGSLDINEPDKKILGDFKFYHVDIRDYDSLKKCTNEFDIIFHNVAQVPLAKNNKLFWSVNVDGTRNICRASLDGNIKKLVYTSSSAVYGIPKTNPVDENTTPSPGEVYGIAKLEGEKVCKSYSRKGLNLSIIRPRTILGHGRLGIFSILFRWISEGINIPVLDNGQNIYQFLHADDLAEACILSAFHEDRFSTFNIGAPDYNTMRITLENLCKYADTESKVISLPMKPIEKIMNITSKLNLTPLAPYHSLMYGRSLYFNSEKSKKELGFTPKFSTSKMFEESYDWFLKNINLINNNSELSMHKKPLDEKLLRLIKWML